MRRPDWLFDVLHAAGIALLGGIWVGTMVYMAMTYVAA